MGDDAPWGAAAVFRAVGWDDDFGPVFGGPEMVVYLKVGNRKHHPSDLFYTKNTLGFDMFWCWHFARYF